MHILFVEDEADIAEIYKKTLSRDGNNVEWVDCISDALNELISDKKFDALITDYNLKDGNGLDFAVRFKEKFSEAKICVMSGEVIEQQNMSEEQNALNAQIFLKPFENKKLKEWLKS